MAHVWVTVGFGRVEFDVPWKRPGGLRGSVGEWSGPEANFGCDPCTDVRRTEV